MLIFYFRLSNCYKYLYLYASSHRQDNTYHSLCYTNVEHWLEREIAQWVHHGVVLDEMDIELFILGSYA